VNNQLQIDGVDVFVEGEGTDTIVMIHGWPDTYRLWDPQVEFFKTRYRCVRFTLPGFDINKGPQARSLEQLIQLFKAIIEHVSPQRPVTLMLHDWGCVFGYQFYMRYPSMISRIIGVDIGDPISLERDLSVPAKLAVVAYQLPLVLAGRIGGGFGDGLSRLVAKALRCESDPQYIFSGMSYPYDTTWFKTHGSYDAAVAFAPTCPMLFAYGTKKPFMFHSSAWSENLKQDPANAVQAFDTSHWVMRDRPEAFNQAVNSWLGGPPK
jgi:pimeloyl-ACP methyl ester carboxylesterase